MSGIKRYKCGLIGASYSLPTGKVIVFHGGMYDTADPEEIKLLDIEASSPRNVYIFVDDEDSVGVDTVVSREGAVELAIRQELRAVNTSNDGGTYVQESSGALSSGNQSLRERVKAKVEADELKVKTAHVEKLLSATPTGQVVEAMKARVKASSVQAEVAQDVAND